MRLLLGSFDFTGEAGKYYALISDESIAVNAKFGTAYTTGLAVDSETLMTSLMREQGTVSLALDPFCVRRIHSTASIA